MLSFSMSAPIGEQAPINTPKASCSTVSIPNGAQPEQNVKQKHSRELETIEELKQQNELLKKQVDYWHSQTAVTVARQVLEEIVCDAMAEMNAFAMEQTKRLCRIG